MNYGRAWLLTIWMCFSLLPLVQFIFDSPIPVNAQSLQALPEPNQVLQAQPTPATLPMPQPTSTIIDTPTPTATATPAAITGSTIITLPWNLRMELHDLLTTIIAIYGAILSTYTVVSQVRKKNYALRVLLFSGDSELHIQVSNPGERMVEIADLGLFAGNQTIATLQTHSLKARIPEHGRGYQLESGRAFVAWIPLDTLTTILQQLGYKGFVRLRASCRNSLAEVYHSQAFIFDLAGYLSRNN